MMRVNHMLAFLLHTTWLLASYALCIVNVYITTSGPTSNGIVRGPYIFRCTNLAPNTCCASTTPTGLVGFVGDTASFSGLPARSVSALWTWYNSPNHPIHSTVRCTQRIIECSSDLNWIYVAPPVLSDVQTRRIITGASYYEAPSDPPDLAWGNPEILKAEIAAINRHPNGRLAGIAASLVAFCLPQNGNRRRLIDERSASAVYAAVDSKWVYPDTIVYNRTEYTNSQLNESVYKDFAGSVLDLQSLQ